ncbi:MAG: flagellar hook-associated protein FlgK [Alphaproteobacteria bacterium]|nr:flagellar hook-associated protein FlgK [Alphaproteobacteria bacterium]
MTGNLLTAMQSAISGRDLAQKQISNCGQNISMANKLDHSRTEQLYSTRVINGVASGVSIHEIKRITDTVKVEQLRPMTSTLTHLETLSTIYNDLNLQIGVPGEDNTFSGAINDFKKSLEVLANTPEDSGKRASVIRMAENLAKEIKRLSDTAQQYRNSADQQIYSAVQDVNSILKNIEEINKEIQYSGSKGNPSTELLDQRDAALTELSKLMDVRVQIDSVGMASIFCNGGGTIMQGKASQISFSQTSAINASVSYASGTVNGLLINGDINQDITTKITEGRIGALLQSRDKEMPALQSVLDQLTGTIRDEINAIHNRGTSSMVPNKLVGTKNGLTTADALNGGTGGVKIAVIDRTTGMLVQEVTLANLSTYATIGDLLTAINPLGGAGTASLDANGALQIQATNANHGIAIGSTTVPEGSFTSGTKSLGFSHYFGLNDFFVTGDTLLGSTPGIANSLKVRSEISTDVTRLANTTLDVTGALNTRVVSSGNGNNFLAMQDLFLKPIAFAASGKLPSLLMPITNYASTILQFTVDQGRHIKNTYEGKNEIFQISQKSLQSIRGVNMQEEMMALMLWQRQQKICTEVILAAQSMMDDLLRMRR